MAPSIPAEMSYIRMDGYGPPEVLRPDRMVVPEPRQGEVLIRVATAGVNRPDILQRQGKYPSPPGASDVLGLEVAGTVVAMGPGVSEWRIGDPICALVSSGGYAEYCVAPVPQCLPVPKGLSMVEAGSIPENYFTVWTNIFERGCLKPGESLLVHGGSSGIGTTAIQLAVQFGARVFATAGSEQKCAECVKLGADHAINYRTKDFLEVILERTGGRGVDVILDIVGGSYVERNLRALAVEGRLVQIAFLETSEVKANFMILMTRRLTWTGSTLRPRSVEEKGAIAAALREHVWPLLENGAVRPLIFKTFPLAEAAEAHRLMESSVHVGKIILVCEASQGSGQ